MATTKQKEAGLSTAEKDRLRSTEFAFVKARKEPLTDARHVRNAIARFNQVEGVTDKERDEAWRRIVRAAKRFGVEVHESSWRDSPPGKAKAGRRTGQGEERGQGEGQGEDEALSAQSSPGCPLRARRPRPSAAPPRAACARRRPRRPRSRWSR